MGEMEERTKRIVASAVELAEEGGFEAVRMRDVAAHAGVALGTFYKRFRSKEDLLVAALELELERLGKRLRQRPLQGKSGDERVIHFFEIATKGLIRKPNLAKAILRALASGDPSLTHRVAAFHGGTSRSITAALRGVPVEHDSEDPTDEEEAVSELLQRVWFATLVGWSGGLHSRKGVMATMNTAVRLLLAGMDRK